MRAALPLKHSKGTSQPSMASQYNPGGRRSVWGFLFSLWLGETSSPCKSDLIQNISEISHICLFYTGAGVRTKSKQQAGAADL